MGTDVKMLQAEEDLKVKPDEVNEQLEQQEKQLQLEKKETERKEREREEQEKQQKETERKAREREEQEKQEKQAKKRKAAEARKRAAETKKQQEKERKERMDEERKQKMDEKKKQKQKMDEDVRSGEGEEEEQDVYNWSEGNRTEAVVTVNEVETGTGVSDDTGGATVTQIYLKETPELQNLRRSTRPSRQAKKLLSNFYV